MARLSASPQRPHEQDQLMAIDTSRSFKPISIAVLTVSDTRTMADDTSGDILAERIKAAGHHLATRALERDDVAAIVSKLSRSEEHTSELQSLMRISYAVFCLKKKTAN